MFLFNISSLFFNPLHSPPLKRTSPDIFYLYLQYVLVCECVILMVVWLWLEGVETRDETLCYCKGWLGVSTFTPALHWRYDGWTRVSYVNLFIGLPLRCVLLSSSLSPVSPSFISSIWSGLSSTNSGTSCPFFSSSWALSASYLTVGQSSLAVARSSVWFWGFSGGTTVSCC